MQCAADALDLLGDAGDTCFLEHLEGALEEAHGDSRSSLDAAALHNNRLGAAAAEASAHAHRASVDAVRAAQHVAQLSGMDIPMLEDLLPLEDLHDPFLEGLEAAAGHHGEPHQYPHQQQPARQAPQLQQAQYGAAGGMRFGDPSDPCSAFSAHLSPTTAGFFGIPAYAEPASPAAALLNNAAAALPPSPLALPPLMAHVLAQHSTPGTVLLPGMVVSGGLQHVQHVQHAQHAQQRQQQMQQQGLAAVFGAQQQHAFAASQAAHAAHAAAAAQGLPPAIAAAQQRATLQQQMQQQMAQQPQQVVRQMQQQAAHAASLVPPQLSLPALQPCMPAQQAEMAASCDLPAGAGTSHMSNGSNGSAAAVVPRSPFEAAAAAAAAAQQPYSEESSEGEHLDEDVLDDAAAFCGMPSSGGPTPAASGSVFTTGDGTADAAALARRGGRPREKKSYDALIDPNLPIEEIRRLRRMLSNRESARRSRRRRQCQVSTLEVELEQLKTDKQRLQSELHQSSSFAQQLSAEKQQLLAELERLRCQLAQVSTTSAPPATSAAAAAAPSAAGPAPNPGAAPPATQPVPAAVLAPGQGGEPLPGGRLPLFIEQAQRLANRLNQARTQG